MPKAMGQCLQVGPEWLDAHFFQSNAARCFQPEILLASVNGCGNAPSVRREMTAQVQVKVLLFVAMPA